MANVVFTLAITCILLTKVHSVNYFVEAEGENYTCSGMFSVCANLSTFANNHSEYFTSNATFIFSLGNHTLSQSILITSMENITLSGQRKSDSVAMVTCPSTVGGFAFKNSDNILISDIAFIGCGQNMAAMTSKMSEFINSTLSFANVQGVQLLCVSIEKSGGIGVFMHNTVRLNISSCSFHNNEDANLHIGYNNLMFSDLLWEKDVIENSNFSLSKFGIQQNVSMAGNCCTLHPLLIASCRLERNKHANIFFEMTGCIQRIELIDVTSTESKCGLNISTSMFGLSSADYLTSSTSTIGTEIADLSIRASMFNNSERANMYINTMTNHYTVEVKDSTISSSREGIQIKHQSSRVQYKIDFDNSTIENNENNLVINLRTCTGTLNVSNITASQALGNGISLSLISHCRKTPVQLFIDRVNITNSGDDNIHFTLFACSYSLMVKNLHSSRAGLNGLLTEQNICKRNNSFQHPKIAVINANVTGSAYNNYHFRTKACENTLILEDVYSADAGSHGVYVHHHCNEYPTLELSTNILIKNATAESSGLDNFNIFSSLDSSFLNVQIAKMTASNSGRNGFTFDAVESISNSNNLSGEKVGFVIQDSHLAHSSGSNMDIRLSVCNYRLEMRAVTSYKAHKKGLVFLHSSQCGHSQQPELLIIDSTFQNNTESGINLAWEASFRGAIILDFVNVLGNTGSGDADGAGIVVHATQEKNESPNGENYPTLFIKNGIIERNGYLPGKPAMALLGIANVNLCNMTIRNNQGSGLQCRNTHLLFSDINLITNNTAVNGGGISLLQSSRLTFNSTSQTTFDNNTAINYGGAIFVSNEGNGNDVCFFDYFSNQSTSRSKPRVIFQGNTAKSCGDVFYSTLLTECNTTNELIDSFDITQQKGVSLIASPPEKLLLCNVSTCNILHDVTEMKVTIPYTAVETHIINITVIALNSLNNASNATVLWSTGAIVSVDAACTNIKQKVYLNFTKSLRLNVSLLDTSNSSHQMLTGNPLIIDVIRKDCPFGFIQDPEEKRCICAPILEQNEIMCDLPMGSIIKNGNNWTTYNVDEACIYVPENCPFDYCNQSEVMLELSDPDLQCMEGRSGVLCGKCSEGLSLKLGSNQCGNCSHSSSWASPTIIIGSGIVGVALIAIIITLNLTVSVGTINGLILFANILKIYESIFFPNGHLPRLEWFLSWINLDLGIDTCFLESMTACLKIGLQFVFPSYLLLVVVLIIILANASQWKVSNMVLPTKAFSIMSFFSSKFATLLGKHAVPVLSTIFLLSYTKIISTIILIFYIKPLECCDAKYNDCNSTFVWYVDGNVEFLHGCHLILFIIAVAVFVVLVVPYTSLLLFFPLFEKYHPKSCTRVLLLFKPIFDAYGGPYKDWFRFWTGLLLLVRVQLALVVALGVSEDIALQILFATSAALTLIVAHFSIYKKRLNNSLEIFFFILLLAMAFVRTIESRVKMYALALSFSFIALSLIIIVHLRLRIEQTEKYVKIKAYFANLMWHRNKEQQTSTSTHSSRTETIRQKITRTLVSLSLRRDTTQRPNSYPEARMKRETLILDQLERQDSPQGTLH